MPLTAMVFLKYRVSKVHIQNKKQYNDAKKNSYHIFCNIQHDDADEAWERLRWA